MGECKAGRTGGGVGMGNLREGAETVKRYWVYFIKFETNVYLFPLARRIELFYFTNLGG